MFKSAPNKSIEKNLTAFISTSKTANPFGKVRWNSILWEVAKKGRASDGRRNEKLWFSSSFVPKTTLNNATPFVEPFASFTKAVICHREIRHVKGLATIDHMVMIRALRYLYISLQIRSNNPNDLRRIDFDSAINSCQKREEPSSAYRIGCKLAEVAGIIDRNNLAPTRLDWSNTQEREAESGGMHHSRLGAKFDKRRAKKLPTVDVLNALYEISNRTDLDDPDLLCQRAIELFMCGGFRPCELLTLPRDCWIEEPQVSIHGNPALDINEKPIVRYGLRYIPAKGAHLNTQIKWLPTVMSDVARRAVNDILRITERYATVATFIENNQHRTLLSKPWHSLPDDSLLTMVELEQVVGLARNGGKSGTQFARISRIPSFRSDSSKTAVVVVAKGDVEHALLKRSGGALVFPHGQAGYSLSRCLFVIGVNFFHATKSLLNGTAILATQGQLRDYMTGRKGAPSIFKRLGILGDDGKEVKLTPYQFRHWLNTLGFEGGLGESEAARWMGRTQISQNSTYNQMSGRQFAENIYNRIQKGEARGPLPDAGTRINDPVRREEFLSSLIATAHVTDLGACINDWSAIPCQKHGQCEACEHLLLEKGNPEQKKRAHDLMDETQALLVMAQGELNQGTYGVNNWLTAHDNALNRLKQIVAVHDDISIPFGTLVHLGERPSYCEDSEGE